MNSIVIHFFIIEPHVKANQLMLHQGNESMEHDQNFKQEGGKRAGV
jgi:hypothetical protein